jgi:hypothetical protein
MPTTPTRPAPDARWRYPRLALSLLLLAWGWYLGAHPGTWTLGLDDINLAIHETGHLVFSPLGEWPTVAGGTLFQLLVPLAFAGSFLHQRDRHAATVALWWVGQNLFNIARYVGDARAQELPLVGGGEHDWTWMLFELDLLGRDVALALQVHRVGIAVILLSSVLGVLWARRSVEAVEPDVG